MDDILILAQTRWKLRRAVRRLRSRVEDLNLDLHPDKTFVGRIEKGFDFLGYRFGQGALGLAHKTVRNHAQRMHRLYEQQAKSKPPL